MLDDEKKIILGPGDIVIVLKVDKHPVFQFQKTIQENFCVSFPKCKYSFKMKLFVLATYLLCLYKL